MTLTIEVSDAVWTALAEKLLQVQTQIPGSRPGEVIIRPVFAEPGEWLEAIIDQNIQQHVPALPDAIEARMLADADALKNNAAKLLKQRRGISVHAAGSRTEPQPINELGNDQ